MLAERPRHPNSRKVEKATRDGINIYFLPDEVHQFGVWTNYPEAEAALQIWLRQFQDKPTAHWQGYCKSRGWNAVIWQ